jgi:hypothetical protein
MRDKNRNFHSLSLVLLLLFQPLFSWSIEPASASILPALPNNTNLIHLWSFNNTLIDEIGALPTHPTVGVTSPIPLSAILYTPGIYDRAMNFNGQNNHLALDDFQLEDQFTIAALLYIESLPDPGKVSIILSHHYACSFAITDKGQARVSVMEESGWDDFYTAEHTLTPGHWYLIVGSYTGNKLRLFVFTKSYQRDENWLREDPVQHFYWGYEVQRSTVYRMNQFHTGWSIGNCESGCDPNQYQYFNGKIDELAIWDIGLTYDQVEDALTPWIAKFKVTPPPPKEYVEIKEFIDEIDEIRIVDPNYNVLERRLPEYDEDTGRLTQLDIYDRYNDFVFFVSYSYPENGMVETHKISTIGEVEFETREMVTKNEGGNWKEGVFQSQVTGKTYRYRRYFDDQGRVFQEHQRIEQPAEESGEVLIEYHYNEFNQPREIRFFQRNEHHPWRLFKRQEILYNAWNLREYVVEFDGQGLITEVEHYFYQGMQYFHKIEVWRPKRGITDFHYFPHEGEFELHHIWIFDYLKKKIRPFDPETPLMMERWDFQPYIFGH